MKGQLGDQKVSREILSNLGFTSSGDVFIIKTECDTKILMTSMTSLLGKVSGQQSSGGGGGPGLTPQGGGPPPGMGSARPGGTP